ncbi:MAG: hypothetical protein R3325_16235, partial [Thermoanaerobaculia bacterium]|nr:hypothetical protein [Thermoanaerobaculia bacterium]
PNGRDLTAGPHPRARAFGMRRGFDPPLEDRRLDGTVEVLDHRLYYTVTPEGRLLRGGAGRLLPPIGDGPELSREAEGELLALFAALEDELAAASAETVTDPETERALRALGYVQ